MNTLQKNLGTLLGIGLAAVLSNNAYANEPPMSKGECAHYWSEGHDGGVSFEKRMEAFEKRMAALHSALKLSASQEAAWTEFSSKMKPVKMEKKAPQDWKNLSTPDRFDRILSVMRSHEQAMAERAAVIRKFYDALTADQKKTFDERFKKHQGRYSPGGK